MKILFSFFIAFHLMVLPLHIFDNCTVLGVGACLLGLLAGVGGMLNEFRGKS